MPIGKGIEKKIDTMDQIDGMPIQALINSDKIDSLMSVRYDQYFDPEFHYIYLYTAFHFGNDNSIRRENLKNYYLTLRDSLKSDFGYYGLGYILLKEGKSHESIKELSKITSDFKYKNRLTGEAFERQGEFENALKSYMNELELDEGEKEQTIRDAVRLAEKLSDQNALLLIAQVPGAEARLGNHFFRKVMFENQQIKAYYRLVINNAVVNLNIYGFFAALLILIGWGQYLLRLSFFDKKKWGLISMGLFLGMITCWFVFPISDTLEFKFGLWTEEHTFGTLLSHSIFGIGAVEEIVKIIPLLLILIKYKLAPYEYILIASLSAAGFAFVENLMYFDGSYGQIIHGRALTAAVGHMIFSSIFAYGLVVSKFNYHKLHPAIAFIVFWFLASLGHGLYDFWIFAKLMFFFFFFFFFIARVWITIINNTLNNSPAFQYTDRINTKSIQFYLTMALTGILMFEYVVVALQNGAQAANQSFWISIISGSFMIMFLGSKLSSLNLIKDYWGKINYSVNPFTDDIVSQNFIGQKIWLSTYYIDQGLAEYYSEGVEATIVAREVLRSNESTLFFSYNEPDWFLVELSNPIIQEGYEPTIAYIKFKDAYSSMNDQKFFHATFLLIPVDFKTDRIMRENYHSIGWVFVRSMSARKKQLEEELNRI